MIKKTPEALTNEIRESLHKVESYNVATALIAHLETWFSDFDISDEELLAYCIAGNYLFTTDEAKNIILNMGGVHNAVAAISIQETMKTETQPTA